MARKFSTFTNEYWDWSNPDPCPDTHHCLSGCSVSAEKTSVLVGMSVELVQIRLRGKRYCFVDLSPDVISGEKSIWRKIKVVKMRKKKVKWELTRRQILKEKVTFKKWQKKTRRVCEYLLRNKSLRVAVGAKYNLFFGGGGWCGCRIETRPLPYFWTFSWVLEQDCWGLAKKSSLILSGTEVEYDEHVTCQYC